MEFLIVSLKLVDMQDDIAYLFEKADIDKSGTLEIEEFQRTMEKARERYPQLEVYLQRQKFRHVVDMVKISPGDAKEKAMHLNVDEFKKSLAQVDKQLKLFPATAQVIQLSLLVVFTGLSHSVWWIMVLNVSFFRISWYNSGSHPCSVKECTTFVFSSPMPLKV